MTPEYDAFLAHFHIVSRHGLKAQAYCPAHSDSNASLSICLAGDKILIFCHAGCTVDSVLSAVKLVIGDLFLNGVRPPEAIYQYRNEDGSLLYEKVKHRFPDGAKTFSGRHLTSDGRLLNNLDGIERLPYNYPQVTKAIREGETIVYCEGEKDAETARILGHVGTTFGGASDWKDEWKRFFQNAKLVQVADNDKAGITLTHKVSRSLCDVSKSVKVVVLPHGKDLTDWVALGHSHADLERLIEESPELVKTKTGFDWRDHSIGHDDLLAKEMEPLDYLVEGLIVTPGLGALASRKKRGKSWLSLQLSQSVASGKPFLSRRTKQGPVVHLALEDGQRRLRQRLKMQNAAKGLPITYVTKFEPLNTKVGFQALTDLIRSKHPVLVVIDTLAAAKNRFLDENEAGSNADLFNRLHELATNENTVILMIAHHGKASTGDAGFDIRGSSAIPGATDVNMGLYKNSDGTFDLKAEGRDIVEAEIRIRFDAKGTWCWQCEGNAKDVRRAQAEQRMLGAIDLLSGEAGAKAIARELKMNRVTVQTHLKRMREEGLLKHRVGLGGNGRNSEILYSRPLTTPTPPTIT